MNIYLNNIWFKYSNSHDWALKRVTLMIESSKLMVIKGPNGSGKTTLLKIASLLYKPTQGQVLVDSVDVWRQNMVHHYRGRIVYLPDKPVIIRGSVYDNIALGLRIQGHNEEDIEERVLEISEKLGIKSLLSRQGRELSAGEKQLVSLARILVLNPIMLLLDEPFTHLDEDKRLVVIDLLNQLRKREMGIVLATHIFEPLRGLDLDATLLVEKGEVKTLN